MQSAHQFVAIKLLQLAHRLLRAIGAVIVDYDHLKVQVAAHRVVMDLQLKLAIH